MKNWYGPVDFMTAFGELGKRNSIKCEVDDGKPVIYGISCDELVIDGKVHHINNFCFSPSQISHGKWYVKK